MALHPFLEKYVEGTPDTCPDLVKAKLADLGPIPATPKSSAQGSAMVTTAICPLAYSVKIHGGLTAANTKHLKTWLATVLRWYWSGDATLASPPQEVVTNAQGQPILNKQGQEIAAQKCDAQHAETDLYLVAAAVSGEPLPFLMAKNIMETFEARGEFSPSNFDPNTRAHTNLWRATASYYGCSKDERAVAWIGNLIHRLNAMADEGPIPYLTVNINEHKDPDGDHNGLGCCSWMEGRGAQAGDETEAWLGALNQKGQRVRSIGRACITYAFTHPAVTVPHTALADYDPKGPDAVSYFPSNAMTRWMLPALAAFDPERAKAAYLAADWTRPFDKNFSGFHNLGITIALAGKFGWR